MTEVRQSPSGPIINTISAIAVLATTVSVSQVTATTVSASQVTATTVSASQVTATTVSASSVQSSSGTYTPGATLTILSGEINPTGSFHAIDTEGGAATDDLFSIYGDVTLPIGSLLFLRLVSSSRTVTFKHGVDNILTMSGADFTLTAAAQVVILYQGVMNIWTVLNG